MGQTPSQEALADQGTDSGMCGEASGGDRRRSRRGGQLRARSWDALDLDARRMSAAVSLVAVVVGSAVLVVTFSLLGDLAVVLGTVVALGSGYALAALPRRSIERSALLQAGESPALAAAASVYLQSSGSKSKTVLMLRSDEPRLAFLLGELRRGTLLGFDPADTYGATGGESGVRVRFQDPGLRRQGPGREARR